MRDKIGNGTRVRMREKVVAEIGRDDTWTSGINRGAMRDCESTKPWEEDSTQLNE